MDELDNLLADAIETLSREHETSRRVLDVIRTERLVRGTVSLDTFVVQMALAIVELETRLIAAEGR